MTARDPLRAVAARAGKRPPLWPVSGLATDRPAFPRLRAVACGAFDERALGRPASGCGRLPLRGQRRLARPGGLCSLLPV